MMQTRNPLLDQVAKLAYAAAETAGDAAREAGAMARSGARRAASDLDLAAREDVDVALELAREALDRVDALEKRIADLEAAAPDTK